MLTHYLRHFRRNYNSLFGLRWCRALFVARTVLRKGGITSKEEHYESYYEIDA